MTLDRLSEAIALIKAGRQDNARPILLQILKEDPRNETAWLWLVQTLPTDEQRIAALEQCLKFIPNSQRARLGLENLRARKTPPAVPPVEKPSGPTLPPAQVKPPFSQQVGQTPASRQELPDLPLRPAKSQSSSSPVPAPLAEVEKKPSRMAALVNPGAPAPTLTPEPEPETAFRRPESKKGPRLNGVDIGAISLIVLIVLSMAGYLLWERFGPAVASRLGWVSPAGSTATASSMGTQTAAALLAPTITPTLTETFTPIPSITPSPTVTVTPIPISLPAPVYFISGLIGGDESDPSPSSYQVWRMETNGITLTQLTFEPSRVVALDVSPQDGSLAYISNNQLILADANGNNRQVLAGGPLPATPSENDGAIEVSSPVWSPDGKSLAYGLNGVNIYTLATGKTTSLIADTIPAADKPQDLRLYEPWSWSPDGRRILARIGGQECDSMTILPAAGGNPPASFNAENSLFIWTGDSQTLYSANPVPGGPCDSQGGLWRVDAATGTVTALDANTADSAVLHLYGWLKLTPAGRLLYFYHEAPAAALNGQTFPHNLYSSDPDGVTDRTVLGQEQFYFFDEDQYLAGGSNTFGEVLWSPDGSLAVLFAARAAGGIQQFWLVRTDGSPVLRLTDMPGSHLRWGVPSSGAH